MRYAIICDVHSNLEALETVLTEVKKREVERIFHLGDIVGYNANPNECIEVFMAENISSIMGNHDAACCGLDDPLWFNSAAKQAIIWTRDKLNSKCREYLRGLPEQLVLEGRILLAHGSPESRDNYILDWMDAMRQFAVMEKTSMNICFYGHSHLPALFAFRGFNHDLAQHGKHTLDWSNRYLVNFGGMGQPRDGDPRTCFGIFDSDEMTVEFFRIKYDVLKCARKVEKAGLDTYLAERLLAGV
ncbi:MAG: metallophosphoesterase [Candidatus Abyssobacteria bacterium SURF_17]|jgi:diadenosine tetraphosphatase ApaH/serine/threonine PP2A family protein phosphatase|uniref:Metallophosphoesterase n=1 Tax=Candidatus Abyssobacteria bacterium SURF_17 TaxID=2093361 RepID=A0A419EZB2_9BACT|nr:MAG: metallophosphoesterase [Candidatus Abyssubacteria bacterium SURF_17]